jgi:hypothetical protein
MDELRRRGLADEAEERAFLKCLIRHADWLADDDKYNAETNHGMMQNMALLTIAFGYPEFDRDGTWRSKAIERTERLLDDSFTDNGVCLELTPMYHVFMLKQACWYLVFCRHHGITPPAPTARKIRAAFAVAAELSFPNHTLPGLADTGGGRFSLAGWPVEQLPDWPEARRLAEATDDVSGPPLNTPGVRYYPESGYFILRAAAPEWTRDQALALCLKTRSKSRAHTHPDLFGFALYAGGQAILQGPGYVSYGGGRRRGIGTWNQSTVSVGQESQTIGIGRPLFLDTFPVVSEATAGAVQRLDTPPEFVAFAATAETYPGVQHTRGVFYGPETGELVVIDEMSSGEAQEYFQNFRLSPWCSAQPAGDVVHLTVAPRINKSLSIRTWVAVGAGPELTPVQPLIDEQSVRFAVKGDKVTFVTRLSVGFREGDVKMSPDGSIVWRGSRGRLTLARPLKSQTYRWEPGRGAARRRQKRIAARRDLAAIGLPADCRCGVRPTRGVPFRLG